MTRRSLFTALVALAVAAWVSSSVSFAKDDATHEGTVVSVSDGKLVMTEKDSKEEHSHDIGATATITLNGKEAKLTELRKGDKIKVTMGADKKVTKIEARRS